MCYLIAKKFYDHGCIALQTNFGQDLKYLSDYLKSRTVGKGIQIVTINNILGYPEYKPYTLIDNEKEFVILVLEMI
jgi:hypothetical protein